MYFTYHNLVQGVGGSELIWESSLEDTDIIPNCKYENEGGKASADPGMGKRLIKRNLKWGMEDCVGFRLYCVT